MIRRCLSRLSRISLLYTLFAVVFSLLVVYSAQASTVKSEYNWDNGTTPVSYTHLTLPTN